MKVFNDGKLNADIADTLYELGNVGVGQASIALGKMLGVGVSISIPKVVPVYLDMMNIIGDDPEKVAMGILMSMEKTLGGVVLFIIEKDFIADVLYKLTGKVYEGEAMVEDEESLSAIQEVANIMAASYMKAIGTYTGIRLFLSPVMVGVDMIGALVSFPIAQLAIQCKKAISVDTCFGIMDKDGKSSQQAGRIIMLPDEESVGKLMEALR